MRAGKRGAYVCVSGVPGSVHVASCQHGAHPTARELKGDMLVVKKDHRVISPARKIGR